MNGAPCFVQDFLAESARRFPGKTALICGDRSITFAELERASDALGADLQRCGVRRGDRVALFMDNSIEMVIGAFGALKAGGVMVPISPTTRAARLRSLLQDCTVGALVANAALAPVYADVAAQVPSVRVVYWAGPAPASGPAGASLEEVLARGGSPPATGLVDTDLAAIIYTSGSTGEPKGVMLTHRNMTYTAWAISTYLGGTPDDVVLCVLPLSFSYGLYQIICGAQAGSTVVIERSLAYPMEIVNRMAEHRVTGLPGVPTIFTRLLQMEAFGAERLPALRYLTNAAAALPPAHALRLQERFPSARVFAMYGQTECARALWLDPARLRDKPGSVGKAIPSSEVYLVDDKGRRVGPGVVGELVVRGAHVMLGYWGNPGETAKRLRDGEIPGEKVLYTGDQFTMDDEGFMSFVGRSDDIFKCRGEKVSPKEIEHVLCAMPEVLEAAVLGVDDPIDGKAIKAFVVAREGVSLTESRVRQHCREHLEARLFPKFVEIRDSLPRTDSGKIRKAAIEPRSGASR